MADTINVPAGTYTLTIGGAGEEVAATGDLDLTSNITIVGAGAGSTTIQQTVADRVFHITGAFTVNISGVTITGGNVNGEGGGLYNNGGTVNITNSAVSGNTTTAGSGNDGAGLYTAIGTVNVTNSAISGNVSGDHGGGLYAAGSDTVNITDSVVTDNQAGEGGGIWADFGTVNLTRSTVSGNRATASSGGGLLAFSNNTVTIVNSAFSQNTANNAGGGIQFGPSGNTATITNSTFSGNSAVFNGGGIDNRGALTVTNSTFSGNSAGADGGGIDNRGALTATNSTFSGNSATNNGGGIRRSLGAVTLTNTIVANSTSGGNCSGTITDGGNNLDSANTCGFTTNALINTDPLLGALASNGGTTQTMALLTGSPAIDAGDDAVCAAAPVSGLDQRGVVRPQGPHCDIGAFEAPVPSGPNLLLNPGFDQTAQYPRVWQYSVPRTLFSSLLDCAFFISPDCSLKLLASRNTAIVTQTVTFNGLAGQQFIFGLSSAAL
ncbi:MAG: right-handed parallel beta-helix repeat-containing protein, partial [Chloroflexota bacterium]